MAYGRRSLRHIGECHPDLQRVAHKAMEIAETLGMDLSCTEGSRGEVEQNAAVARKTSKVRYPDSRHNKVPSEAIHLQLFPVKWPQKTDSQRIFAKKTGRFYMCAIIVMWAAHLCNVSLRGGYDWDRDGDIMDQDFDDLTHFELITRFQGTNDPSDENSDLLKQPQEIP